jgi:hypothetical protein
VTKEIQTNVLLQDTKQAIRIVKVLAALAILLLCPQSAYANPVTWFSGNIRLTEHGLPYRKPFSLTVHCYWGSGDYKKVYDSRSISRPCCGCTLDIFFSGGTCDLAVETLEGEMLAFDGFFGDAAAGYVSSTAPSGELWRNFEATIDVGTGTYEFTKTKNSILRINSYQAQFVIALLMTLPVETLTMRELKLILKLTHVTTERLLIAGVISLITLPCVWFLLPCACSLLPFSNYAYCIAVAEALVIIVEAGIYYRVLGVKISHAILLSFAANTLSFFVGVLLL